MTTAARLLEAFECHSPTGIRSALDAGIDVHAPIKGKLPIDHMIEMYFRSDAFPDCLRVLLDHGAHIDDKWLLAVLLNDVSALDSARGTAADVTTHRVSLPCTFTPLVGATLLHVAAEYGHVAVATRLIDLGADVNATAAVDAHGYNGHTPLFHAVNSNDNRSAPMMRLLLEAGARTDVLLPGIVWGQGFDWETVCVDVTPISYAQLGLLPQMHRTESHIYENITALLEAAGRPRPPLSNVPNKYLQS